MKTLKSHLQHHRLRHINISQQFHCGYDRCKVTYRVKNHLYNHLRQCHKVSVKQEGRVLTLPAKNDSYYFCTVFSCGQKFHDHNTLMKHLKWHIRGGSSVQCPMINCPKKYTIVGSFTTHISRCHRVMEFERVSHEPEPSSIDEQTANELDMSINDYGVDESVAIDDDSCSGRTVGHEVDDDLNNDFFNNLVDFYLKLESQFTIPVSTIQKIIENMQILNDASLKVMNNHLKEILKNENFPSDKIEAIIKEVSSLNPFSTQNKSLNSDYKRKKVYREQRQYVDLCEQFIRQDGSKKICFHYVPIGDTLRRLFNSKSLVNFVHYNGATSNDQILKDFTDGEAYKNNVFFKNNPTAIKLFLYQDSFQVVNPLGAAKQKYKILAVYASLGELPPHIRTHVNTIQLVALCKEVDFDHDKIYGRIVEDLRILEDEGLEIAPGVRRKVGLAFIAGDNLGSHSLGGFLENFSKATFFCRYCHIKQGSLQDSVSICTGCKDSHYHQNHYPIRTVQSYNENVQQAQEKGKPHKGVKFNSVFNKLQSFHVCSPGLPPCLGHDVMEGFAAYDVMMFLKYFVANDWFTFREINHKIETFNYSIEARRDKPCLINSEKDKLVGGCWQIFTFIYLFPLIIEGNIKNVDDPIWKTFLTLLEIIEIICAYEVDKSYLPYLDELINEYLMMRTLFFSDIKLRPKHHYLTHYPELIRSFGPLMLVWTLRFESKHKFFKRVFRTLGNYKNVTKSLTIKHELFQCLLREGSDLRNDVEIGIMRKCRLDGFNADILNAIKLTCSHDIKLDECFKVVVKGTTYKPDQAVILRQGDYEYNVKIGVIARILVDAFSNVYLLVENTENEFNPLLRIYELKNKFSYECVPIQNLCHFEPLYIYTLDTIRCIRLKRGIVGLNNL